MTAWNKLLVATTRLLDLHDSAHEPGSPFVQVTQEQRRGLRDGYWLDLGCLLLDYLLEVDFATNSAFVTQRRCLTHLREDYPDLPADDLSFVINLLATPSEIHFREWQAPRAEKGMQGDAEDGAALRGERSGRSTKRTSLIEKQGQTGQVRLTPSGRQTVTLASQVEDLLYSEYDAAKVVAALSRGDYSRVPDITQQILMAIRALTQELRRVRENPTHEGKLAALLDNERHYHNALSTIQSTLLSARSQLSTPALIAQFGSWAGQQEEEWDLRMLSGAIGRVLNAIENLSRRLSELLSDIAEGRIQSMGVIDFAGLAHKLLLSRPPRRLQDAVIARMMPLGTEVVMPRVETLLPLVETRRAERSGAALVFDEAGDKPSADPLLARYLKLQGPALRQRLRQAPLSLPEALSEGWHHFEAGSESTNTETLDCLPQLLNTFVDTQLLDDHLSVGIDDTPFTIELPDGRRIEGAVTPSLRLRQTAPEEQEV
ncbi:hypothetical protein [Salinicola halimionae]|uniref:hypothetical protein n=1 Tax=Salinicola halimionae TaxID=1949081 RepID=UPI000DA15249|nr:hypothetical protein [Salinicola halimionae]